MHGTVLNAVVDLLDRLDEIMRKVSSQN